MYIDLKNLFGTDTPSVRQFKAKLTKLSEEDQVFYRRAALEAAFLDWEKMPPRYHDFITDLFTHNWQKTLDYLLHSTVMGSLRFEPADPKLLQRIFTLLESERWHAEQQHAKNKNPEKQNLSFVHLAFAFLLVFKENYSIKYFSKLLRVNDFTDDDFVFLLELLKHDNEPGQLPKGNKP